MTAIKHQYILVGLEIDPTGYPQESQKRPRLLDRVAAEQVLALIADELAGMLAEIKQCALTMAGALFDQAQILRPGLPVYAALETWQRTSNPGGKFQPRLLSIGASAGRMPNPLVQPETDTSPGALLVLPILMSGPANVVAKLIGAMEQLFLERGELASPACRHLASDFHISLNHARFMTITDLNALLRLQLELFGFLPLWELLDTAINQPGQARSVTSAENLKFAWRENAVHSSFETFDWWAAHGGGKNRSAKDQQLQVAYADWTREYRQYITMLAGHGITVKQHLAGHGDVDLNDTFLLEESTMEPGKTSAAITEHSMGDLGTLAITVVDGGRQMNFYPLRANGLTDLQDYIRAQGWAGHSAFPGHLCVDEETRRLIADTL